MMKKDLINRGTDNFRFVVEVGRGHVRERSV
jgi:hypothetical protein